MEFNLNINTIFGDTITTITGDFYSNRHDKLQAVRDLEEVIDTIGRKSAQAQNLSAPITTWSKLRINKHKIYLLKNSSSNSFLFVDLVNTELLYLLKNSSSNSIKGQVIGFIKIGRKQLFVLDRDGKHNEMHPLCILDFYVHESQQRRGQGLRLFKYMLQAENVQASHLAIDRPSSKFISFLRKHFNLWATIPQVNNFVVFDGFFRDRKDKKSRQPNRHKEYEETFRPLSRAFSEDVIKRNRRTAYNDSLNGIRPMSGSTITGTGDFKNHYTDGQGARANMYSRFAIDENSYIPSPPENRRRSLKSRQNEEIITNPYRRVPDNLSKSDELGHSIVKEESKPLHEIQTSHINADFPETIDEETTHQGSKTEADKSQPDCKKARSPDFLENIFVAKTGHNSIRYSQYDTPSDMISELKRKDQESRHGRSRSRNSFFSTSSWNVFGIASPAGPKWRNK